MRCKQCRRRGDSSEHRGLPPMSFCAITAHSRHYGKARSIYRDTIRHANLSARLRALIDQERALLEALRVHIPDDWARSPIEWSLREGFRNEALRAIAQHRADGGADLTISAALDPTTKRDN